MNGAKKELEPSVSGDRAKTRPSAYARDVDSERARWLGVHASASAAESTRSRVVVATFCRPFITNDTVALEVPARAATSLIVGRGSLRGSRPVFSDIAGASFRGFGGPTTSSDRLR